MLGITIRAQAKIEQIPKYMETLDDEDSAIDTEATRISFNAILNLMEKNGLI